MEGLLSARGLRSLDAACDAALDDAENPLNLWQRVEAEVSDCSEVGSSARRRRWAPVRRTRLCLAQGRRAQGAAASVVWPTEAADLSGGTKQPTFSLRPRGLSGVPPAPYKGAAGSARLALLRQALPLPKHGVCAEPWTLPHPTCAGVGGPVASPGGGFPLSAAPCSDHPAQAWRTRQLHRSPPLLVVPGGVKARTTLKT